MWSSQAIRLVFLLPGLWLLGEKLSLSKWMCDDNLGATLRWLSTKRLPLSNHSLLRIEMLHQASPSKFLNILFTLCLFFGKGLFVCCLHVRFARVSLLFRGCTMCCESLLSHRRVQGFTCLTTVQTAHDYLAAIPNCGAKICRASSFNYRVCSAWSFAFGCWWYAKLCLFNYRANRACLFAFAFVRNIKFVSS